MAMSTSYQQSVSLELSNPRLGRERELEAQFLARLQELPERPEAERGGSAAAHAPELGGR